VLAGIGAIETDHGRADAPGVHSGRNSFGCCAGPMRFNLTDGPPSTWATTPSTSTTTSTTRCAMSRTIESIDMPAWPPSPWAVRVVSAMRGGVIVRAVVGHDPRVAHVARRRLPRAVKAALAHPRAQVID
jgi:hypothetical protein